jgi:hypothetical protein
MVSAVELRDIALRQWHRWRRRIGDSGMAGVTLGCAALVLMGAMPSWQRNAEASRSALDQRRQALTSAEPAASAPAATTDASQRWAEALPPFSQNASDLEQLFDAGQAMQVTLARGDYSLKSEAGSPYLEFTATFPAQEGYGALRNFATEVLRKLPHAALDELRLTRPNSTATILDASVRITLFYRRN